MGTLVYEGQEVGDFLEDRFLGELMAAARHTAQEGVFAVAGIPGRGTRGTFVLIGPGIGVRVEVTDQARFVEGFNARREELAARPLTPGAAMPTPRLRTGDDVITRRGSAKSAVPPPDL